MKIQIDLDPELWNRFRDVVIAKGQTLKEVVPTVFEPALRWYLHDPPLTTQGAPQITPGETPGPTPTPYKNICDKCGKEIKDVEFISGDGFQKRCLTCMPFEDSPPPLPQVKRCDLCDMPTERTFNHKGRKVCYVCWRDGIINEGTKQEPEVKQ